MEPEKQSIKSNIGCGGRPLDGYINIDSDDLETLKHRYPQQQFSEDLHRGDRDPLINIIAMKSKG